MKVCEITGKVAIVGNNVSHSHHKTKRKFSPNLKTKRFWSEQEGRWITLKVSAEMCIRDRCYTVRHPALEREVFGVKFANPIGLAAGFDRNGEAYRELAALGFGFIEIGTVTPRPQAGNPRPRVFRLPKDRAIINRIGLSNRGLDKTICHLRRPHEGIIVGCNIGKNTVTPPENAAADYLRLFRNLYQYADYFTVNIRCDNS